MDQEIVDGSPFRLLPLYVSDGDGRPLLVSLVKGSFLLQRNVIYACAADQRKFVLPEGEFYGAPDRSSYKYEPEVAFTKPATDVVLIGHAFAPSVSARQVDVTLRVGELSKSVRVVGNRTWVKRLGVVDMTNPEPFEKIPLIYERAFGGWDSPEPDPFTSRFESRNPVGVGLKQKQFTEGLPLPNLEDPKHPLKYYGDTPPPAGFGFLSPHWQPRVKYAGTYDEKWQQQRSPRLPLDFDPRFFNAASPGLISKNYLRGDEEVWIEGVSPSGPISFRLPGVQAPRVQVQLRSGEDALLHTNLDTVIINTDENLVLMLWRSSLLLRSGPHDVTAVRVITDGIIGSRPQEL